MATTIEFVTIEVTDTAAAEAFHTRAFDVADRVLVGASQTPSTGFRGFTSSLVVSQPATVRSLIDIAASAGATVLKPAAKSLWGCGGLGQALDKRAALVKTGGVPEGGAGSHRLLVRGNAGAFTDPDGFVWEAPKG